MNLFEVITLPVKNFIDRQKFENREISIGLKMLESAASNIVQEESDRDDWTLISTSTDAKDMDANDRDSMLTQVFNLSHFNPQAKAALRNMVKYIIGKSIKVTANDTMPEVQAVWDEFVERNKFMKRQKEIIHRTFRDGETFLRYFKESGLTDLRFVDAREIKNDLGNTSWSDGIKCDDDDIETPEAYRRIYSKDSVQQTEDINADEIQHIKILCDSDEKRGRSFLLAVLYDISQYRKWLKDRIVLNKVRSAVAMVKHIKGTPTQLASNVSAMPNKTTGTTTSKKMFKPGTTIIANEGVEYEFIAPNLQASDTQIDGRNILLSIAAGVGETEYMFGDASNNNYASSLVSESPFIREVEDWQDFFEYEFKEIFRRVIQNAIDAGILPKRSKEIIIDGDEEKECECDIKTTCDITWPQFAHRNIQEETNSLVLQRQNEILSKRTMASRLDLDYDAEQRFIRKEQDEQDAKDKEFDSNRAKEIDKDENGN